MRHGEAAERNPGGSDRDRALTPRGRELAAAILSRPAADGVAPDLILCSAARRAVETLAAIRPHLPAGVAESVESDLYLASGETLLERIREVEADCEAILLVGHNPGIGRLAYELARPVASEDYDRLSRSFPTGALVTLRFDLEDWGDVRPEIGHLEFLTPSGAVPGPR